MVQILDNFRSSPLYPTKEEMKLNMCEKLTEHGRISFQQCCFHLGMLPALRLLDPFIPKQDAPKQ